MQWKFEGNKVTKNKGDKGSEMTAEHNTGLVMKT